jgi:broad specificity phosphatase PhoE
MEGRFQGRTDVPLSDIGRLQARAIAQALANVSFSRVYASTLQRAVETAQIIAKPRNLRVETDARLREFDFGDWEGLTWGEIVTKWPELAAQAFTSARQYHPHGGEAFGVVVDRVRQFLNELFPEPGERILIVAHAGTLHAAIDALHILPPEQLGFSTASITRIAMDGGRARLMVLNDVSHLNPST